MNNYPTVRHIDDALALQPDAVIVANPTSLHLDIAIPAAAAGCSLLIEKPVSHNLDHLDELKTVVQQSGSKVLIGYQFRHHPGLKKVVELLKSGRVGKALSVRAQWSEWLPGWHPWEDYRQGYSARRDLGGGVTLTLSHPIDYLLWFFGEVESIWALSANTNELDIDVEDMVEIGLQFKNGVIGSLHLDYNGRPATHRLEIIGSQGTITWDNQDGAVNVYSTAGCRHGHPLAEAQDQDPTWERFELPEGFTRNHLFVSEMKHFMEITRSEVEPVCTLENGILTLELALAALRSARTGNLEKLNPLVS